MSKLNKVRLTAVLVLTFLITSVSWASTFYVDAVNGKDANTGRSAASPWKTIAKVNSFHLKPGDAVLLKRDGIWKETLTVKQSGTSSGIIKFGAYGTGNRPVIDGSMKRSYGIYSYGKSFIEIRDIRFQNMVHGAIRISGGKYITVYNCDIYITGRAGVYIENSSYSVILNNRMNTPDYFYNVQTDGIYAQRNSFNSYDGNHIVISNQHTKQHCEAIQTYLETSAIVRNNYIEQNNYKANARGIYCLENKGIFRIYNNVGYAMNTSGGLLKFKNTGSTGTAQMISNTLYGGKGGLVQSNDPNVVFKNNIIVTAGSSPVVIFEKAIVKKSNINHNLYKCSTTGGSIVVYKGASRTMAQWQSSGFDNSGLEADPKFRNIFLRDFTLAASSPALNKGVDLTSPYNVDKAGTLKPNGMRSDIGAYEMKVSVTAVDGEQTVNNIKSIPGSFGLAQNYPNPFNTVTTIRFSIPVDSEVSLKIFDITGSLVTEEINDYRNAGNHEINFNAAGLASGTYIYTLNAKDFTETRKMILMK